MIRSHVPFGPLFGDRLRRLPVRLLNDLKLIWLVQNWWKPLAREWTRCRWIPCALRCGAVLSGPKSAHLDYLFHEIWLKHVYTPTGYSIGPDDVTIDIGANIGVFTLYAAIQARRGRVIAYEPCATAFITWKRICRIVD